MSSAVPVAAERRPDAPPGRRRTAGAASGREAGQRHAGALLTAAIAAAIGAVALIAGGGLRLESTAGVEIALIGGGALVSAAAVIRTRGAPLHGGLALGGLLALAALTAASIVWSLAPADSWEEANRTLAYVAVFALGLSLARLAPDMWRSAVSGVALGCVAVCAYAVATKVFPGALAPDETYARLREPFGYWNAVGLMAALGVPPLLWLGARRSGPPALNALAWPGLALMLVALMLSYSRGSLLALAAGVALWLAVVPLRLRSVAALGAAGAGAGLVTAWAFRQDALTSDQVLLDARIDAGQELGLLLACVLVALFGVGLAVTFAVDRHPLRPHLRRRAGTGLLALAGAAVLAGVIALAAAPGGIDGQVSNAFERLTDPDAATPSNTPDRLTATSSVRARYWDEALHIHADNELLGAGAGAYVVARQPFRTGVLEVRHAHGYVAQTLADLGWAGLAVSLAALFGWLGAAVRTTRMTPEGLRTPFGPERMGLLALTAVVVAFGVHSAIDWTYFVPATAAVALLAAGWVAGRGPVTPPTRAAHAPRTPVLPAVAPAVLVVALAAAAVWAAYQPVRALHAGDDAIAALERGDGERAAALAREAVELNPLSVEPLWELASIERARDRQRSAARALEAAVVRQPANAEAWRRLGRLRLERGDEPGAVRAFQAAYRLDPASPASESDLVEALRARAGATGAATAAP